MSISNTSQSPNPTKRYVEWQGSEGFFFYYDKEKKEKVKLPKTFQVIALDELATIKGYDEGSESGVYSNEVRSTNKEELTVKNFKGDLLAKGLYADIKGNLKGGKYCKSIYAVTVDKSGVGDLINLQIKGSALNPWIEGKINVSGGVVIECSINPEQKKKGSNKYFEPTFTVKTLTEGALRDAAIQLDQDVLQPYLEEYLSGGKKEEVSTSPPQQQKTGLENFIPPPITGVGDATEIDDLPF